MVIGIILILAGLMIAAHPPLLAIIVAGLLIFVGITPAIVSYRFKKMHKNFDDPFTNFFIRF